MSDEFGTVNVRRGDRAREIEIMRQQYRRHREALAGLVSDAPTDHLASEYRRLTAEVEAALAKLDELEGRVPPDTQPTFRPEAASRAAAQPQGTWSAPPGSRALVQGPAVEEIPEEPRVAGSTTRVALIIGIGLVVLAIIGWLMWRASRNERPLAPITTEQTDTAPLNETVAPVTPAPRPIAEELTITPATQDFGVIRKGTRAVRQFEVVNNGDAPFALQVARSTCRCLYYSHAASMAPKKKETLTVTIDGARAKSGAVRETIAVSAKNNPNVTASFNVTATVR